MVTHNENDILFDDVSILIKLSGKNQLTYLSPNNDCDCISNFTTSNQDECDTDQITSTFGQTN